MKRFFLLVAILFCLYGYGQNVTKTKISHSGYTWYKLKSGNLYGAEDLDGNIIVPIKYNYIAYHIYGQYFLVSDYTYSGVYSRRGTCVIPIEDHYTTITTGIVGGTPYNTPANYLFWCVKKNGTEYGVLDARGNVVIDPENGYHTIIMKDKGVAPCFSIYSGDILDDPSGMADLNGNVIQSPLFYHGFDIKKDLNDNYYIEGVNMSHQFFKKKINKLPKFEDSKFDFKPFEGIRSYQPHPLPNEYFITDGNTLGSSSSNSTNVVNDVVDSEIAFKMLFGVNYVTENKMDRKAPYNIKFDLKRELVRFTLSDNDGKVIETHSFKPLESELDIDGDDIRVYFKEGGKIRVLHLGTDNATTVVIVNDLSSSGIVKEGKLLYFDGIRRNQSYQKIREAFNSYYWSKDINDEIINGFKAAFKKRR